MPIGTKSSAACFAESSGVIVDDWPRSVKPFGTIVRNRPKADIRSVFFGQWRGRPDAACGIWHALPALAVSAQGRDHPQGSCETLWS